jgi:hypothetical protein
MLKKCLIQFFFSCVVLLRNGEERAFLYPGRLLFCLLLWLCVGMMLR